MEKKDMIEIEGIVTRAHPAGFFRVLLDNQETILAYISGNIRQKSIRILVGDRVKVELHICDLTRGRITHRIRKAKS
uniref:Translation initiation factor IF-1, chloroplastic n=1 Tax=Gnetum ula TaxID=3383 RepID=A0A0S3QP96_9SPER|nr:translation initiation factor 1 [Gnetum ula]BAT70159.1 translation initiation factor 1 [Gnetum ula]